MPGSQTLVFYLLSASALSVPAASQSTGGEFWPELGIYLQQGQSIRLEFVASASSNPNTDSWQGNFTFYVESALKPVFRRQLRDEPDVYRNRYLTFRAGYRYRTSLTPGDPVSENRLISSRSLRDTASPGNWWFPTATGVNSGSSGGRHFPPDIATGCAWNAISNTARISSRPTSTTRSFTITRYDQWTPNRYAVGLQFPVGQHLVLEPYYLRQDGNRSNPPHINVFGFKFNLYF